MRTAQHPYHQGLHLQNFTAFEDADLTFSPGINAFAGENGSGKTHVLKALYAWQLASSREGYSIQDTFAETFQTHDTGQLTRLGTRGEAAALLSGQYGDIAWTFSPVASAASQPTGELKRKVDRPVFIPAMDMMGHTRRFVDAYDEVRLDFDRTCKDIVSLTGLERKNGRDPGAGNEVLISKLGGEIDADEEGRFYLTTSLGRLPMPLVAEGIRKIATLVQLQRNGWLSPGATLMWDEPEVNLNPVLMGEVVGAIINLARSGVQVFLATHSYVILKELDLQAVRDDAIRYFAYQRGEHGTAVFPTDDFAQLKPNPILEEFDSLYDRELTRSTGRTRRGEPVR